MLVNNAGVVRDRMVFTTSEAEWDAVIRVHLKGHFAVTRHASEYWRSRSKGGETVDARIVNTSSGAGLLGSVGQGAYSAAKAGIAGLTMVEAAELGRYGVTANATARAARTLMPQALSAAPVATPRAAALAGIAAATKRPPVLWTGHARAPGLATDDYQNDKVLEDGDLLYSGSFALPADFWTRQSKTIESWQQGSHTFYRITGPIVGSLLINQFVFFEAPGEPQQYARVTELRAQKHVLQELKD